MNHSQQARVILARYQFSQDHYDQIISLLELMREASLSEEGCLCYQILVDTNSRTNLVLYEVYSNKISLELHRNSQHYREIVSEKSLPMLQHREVQILQIKTP